MKKKTSNYEYFVKTDTTRYKGQWIAISDKKVVACGKDAQSVYRKATSKYPKIKISLAKIPDEQVMVLKIHSPS